MPTPHEFYLQVNEKRFDEDGRYGCQCVDGFKTFLRIVLGLNWGKKTMCSPTNLATSIWDNFESLGLNKYFDKVPSNQMVDGDWAIWKIGSKSCPQSHIAMFRLDNGNGTGIFLGQNQLNHPEFTQINIFYDGIRGGLRPKIYHQAPQGEKVDQILHKGSKVQIPGTFEVVDINVKENTALVRINGKDYLLSSVPLKEV